MKRVGSVAFARAHLEEQQREALESLQENGHVFDAPSNNSIIQRGTLASGVLLKGAGVVDGNCVKQYRLLGVQNRRLAEKMRNFLVLEARPCEEKLNWKEEVHYYYGSSRHRPALPDVDASLEKKLAKGELKQHRDKRDVVTHCVEDLLGEGKWRVADSPNGVVVTKKFLKLPRGSSNPKGVYDCFVELEAHCNRTKGLNCRTNTEGLRLAVRDGEGSCYMNVGSTTQKYGKGVKAGSHEVVGRPAFQDWLKGLTEACRQYLPRHLSGPMEAVNREHEHPGLMQELKAEELWKALACGRNNFLNAHQDDDCCWSVTTVISKVPDESVVCYFVFPDMEDLVPLRHGDLLMFNPDECHCVSARVDGTKDAFCASLYISAGVAGQNNRDAIVPEHLRVAASAYEEATRGGRKQSRTS